MQSGPSPPVPKLPKTWPTMHQNAGLLRGLLSLLSVCAKTAVTAGISSMVTNVNSYIVYSSYLWLNDHDIRTRQAKIQSTDRVRGSSR